MLMSADLLANVVALLAVGLMLYIAWHDFWHLTIRNSSVLALFGLYVAWVGLSGLQTLAGDLGTGFILFVVGFVMWRGGMMGGGDVKLYFVLGLFMGFDNVGLFAAGLLLTTVLFLLALRIAARITSGGDFLIRLRAIRDSGRAPYAVPLCMAAVPLILLRISSSG